MNFNKLELFILKIFRKDTKNMYKYVVKKLHNNLEQSTLQFKSEIIKECEIRQKIFLQKPINWLYGGIGTLLIEYGLKFILD